MAGEATREAGAGTLPNGRSTASRQTIVIDGVAEITSRRLLRKSAAERAAARRDALSQEQNWEQTEADAKARGFGRRRESFFANAGRFGRTARSRTTLVSRRHEDETDLLRQALDLSRHARLKPLAEPVGAEAALPHLERLIGRRAGRRALLVAGFLAGFMAIPVFVLSSTETPVAAPIAHIAVADRNDDALKLEKVTASFVPRGAGKVLTVEGTVRNGARTAIVVPPLRIALADRGTLVGERAMPIGAGTLAAGETLTFVTRLAVASESTGDLQVGFATANAGRQPTASTRRGEVR